MNFLNFYSLFFTLIPLINGIFWTNTSYANIRRVTRDKPNEFHCAETNIMTSVMKLIFGNPTEPAANANIKLNLIERNGESTAFGYDKIDDIKHSNFEPRKKTVIIAHGFMGYAELDWIERMASAYLRFDVNVLVVDWSIFSRSINYHKVAGSVPTVGAQVADLLGRIYAAYDKNTHWGPIHMVGFSLGAHVVGVAADKLKGNPMSWKVARITGLDPAHPCFRNNEMALDKEDAPFVDVIHTNGNKAFGVTLGMLDAIGHVDFYVNGGQLQPGCKVNDFFKFGLWIVPANVKEAVCSHSRAVEYFIESLEIAADGQERQLLGSKWDFRDFCAQLSLIHMDTCQSECKEMGVDADDSGDQGTYFVPTANEKPFNVIKPSDQDDIVKELQRVINNLDDPLPLY